MKFVYKKYEGIPDFLEEVLDKRYNCYRVTKTYIYAYYGDDVNTFVISQNDDIHEVIIFKISNNRCTVYNEVVDINDKHIESFVNYIFEQYRKVHEVKFWGMLKPYNGNYIHLNYICNSQTIIKLPKSKEDFNKMISRKTGQKFRGYLKKIESDIENVTIDYNKPFVLDDYYLLEDIMVLKNKRFRSKNEKNSVDKKKVDLLNKIALKYGRISYIKSNSNTIGVLLCYKVERIYYAIAVAFDIDYYKYSIGRSIIYPSILTAIDEGCEYYNLLWGGRDYTTHYGASNEHLYGVKIFKRKNRSFYQEKLSVSFFFFKNKLKGNEYIIYIYRYIKKILNVY